MHRILLCSDPNLIRHMQQEARSCLRRGPGHRYYSVWRSPHFASGEKQNIVGKTSIVNILNESDNSMIDLVSHWVYASHDFSTIIVGMTSQPQSETVTNAQPASQSRRAMIIWRPSKLVARAYHSIAEAHRSQKAVWHPIFKVMSASLERSNAEPTPLVTTSKDCRLK